MAEANLGQTIGPAIVLMGAAVVAVPLFRRLGLGSVLGYFAAGVIVALALAAMAIFGFSPPVAFIAGAGFVLSSTAVIMSVLQDRGETSSPEGQRRQHVEPSRLFVRERREEGDYRQQRDAMASKSFSATACGSIPCGTLARTTLMRS